MTTKTLSLTVNEPFNAALSDGNSDAARVLKEQLETQIRAQLNDPDFSNSLTGQVIKDIKLGEITDAGNGQIAVALEYEEYTPDNVAEAQNAETEWNDLLQRVAKIDDVNDPTPTPTAAPGSSSVLKLSFILLCVTLALNR